MQLTADQPTRPGGPAKVQYLPKMISLMPITNSLEWNALQQKIAGVTGY